MRTGRRPILALLSCLLVALVGVFAVAPTRAFAGGGYVSLLPSTFPDNEFRNLLKQPAFDWNQDGFLDDTEVAYITELDLTDTTINDLTGIRFLTSLSYLRVGGSMGVTELDLNGMPNLVTVNCDDYSPLTKINVSNCPKLRGLGVRNSSVRSLDLTGCPAMYSLDGSGAKIMFVAFDGGNKPYNVDLSNQQAYTLHCFSEGDGNIYISLAGLAYDLGFDKFDPHKVTSFNSAAGWRYDGELGCFYNSNAAAAVSQGLTYVYDDCFGVTIKVDTVPVKYSWTGAPQGAKLPVDNKGYDNVNVARSNVDTTYGKGSVVKASNGTYVFSGWTAASAVDSSGILKFTGSWSLYSASGASNWTRVWGQDHYDTAAAVCRADKVFSSTGGTVVLATGESYWDALSASGLAGLYRAPILITPGSSLGSQARAELQRLRPSRVVVMGGWMAVSDSTLAAVRQAVPGAKVERCYGQAQDDTARAAFQAAPRSSWGDTCVVATSNGYWDALSIAPYAYSRHAPIFLTRGGAGAQNVLSPATMSAIRAAGFKRVVIVGGTMAVPASVESSLRSAGLTVTRLWGQDHYDTSAAIAKWELSQGMTTAHMAVSTGRGYWDALSGAALVGAQGSVVAIADDGHLQAIDAVYQPNDGKVQGGYVLGGEMAVSDAIWKYLTTYRGGAVG